MGDEKGKDPWPELRLLPMGRRIELDDGHGRTYVGTVVPNHGFTADRILQLKLANGYNVGLRIDPTARYHLLPEVAHDCTSGECRAGPLEEFPQ